MEVKGEHKQCPFCGGKKLTFKYNEVRGHGDFGFSDGRVACVDCGACKGDVYGYGVPEQSDIEKALIDWNKRG